MKIVLRISLKIKKADYFVYSKSGASADNEINAISSATITSNAVTHGVNAAIYCVKYITGGGK
ncbi:MAG: FMN-binding protein [Eubacterium sp.]|uniref:FMN-binding protein n=1 Tax=Eubacterium sp. TaxID=142586 RepID=UPI003994B927